MDRVFGILKIDTNITELIDNRRRRVTRGVIRNPMHHDHRDFFLLLTVSHIALPIYNSTMQYNILFPKTFSSHLSTV
jgi:hypothetical protein